VNYPASKVNEDHQMKIAGKLIESHNSGYMIGHISQTEGESYEKAVKRVVKLLPAEEKVKLRSSVDWVLEHEANDKRLGEYQ